MLRNCKLELQKASLYNSAVPSPPDFDDLNSIDIIPEEIKVHGSDTWEQKDLSLVKDYQTIECTLDWTFSSPFKGTISKLNPVLFDVELP